MPFGAGGCVLPPSPQACKGAASRIHEFNIERLNVLRGYDVARECAIHLPGEEAGLVAVRIVPEKLIQATPPATSLTGSFTKYGITTAAFYLKWPKTQGFNGKYFSKATRKHSPAVN